MDSVFNLCFGSLYLLIQLLPILFFPRFVAVESLCWTCELAGLSISSLPRRLVDLQTSTTFEVSYSAISYGFLGGYCTSGDRCGVWGITSIASCRRSCNVRGFESNPSERHATQVRCVFTNTYYIALKSSALLRAMSTCRRCLESSYDSVHGWTGAAIGIYQGHQADLHLRRVVLR